ncbi:MAG: hypothetical protein JST51_20565 [Armatimonadetes bacterium]|nr:hypothetical protein [Armatimonadota bacterium]
MSYNDWLQAIRKGGVDPRVADQAWLRSQFGSGTPPSVVINAMVTDRFPRAPLSPMVFTPPQAPGRHPRVAPYIPRRYPPSAFEKGLMIVGLVFVVLTAIIAVPAMIQYATLPHVRFKYLHRADDYSLAKLVNRSDQRLTGIVVWHKVFTSDGQVLTDYGQLESTSLDPGQSTTARFNEDEFIIRGKYDGGDLLIFDSEDP